MAMSRDQRVARAINMRKGKPVPPPRPTPGSVQADLNTIDAATDDPTIHAATARIRAALSIEPTSTTPCPATSPHDDGGLYVCTLTTHIDGMHFDEERSCHWLPDHPTA